MDYVVCETTISKMHRFPSAFCCVWAAGVNLPACIRPHRERGRKRRPSGPAKAASARGKSAGVTKWGRRNLPTSEDRS